MPVPHWCQWTSGVIVLPIVAKIVADVFEYSVIRWGVIWSRAFADAILQGVLITIVLTIVSMELGVVGGVAVAIMRLSDNRTVSGLFVWLFRGTPILVHILIRFNLALFLPALDSLFGQGRYERGHSAADSGHPGARLE